MPLREQNTIIEQNRLSITAYECSLRIEPTENRPSQECASFASWSIAGAVYHCQTESISNWTPNKDGVFFYFPIDTKVLKIRATISSTESFGLLGRTEDCFSFLIAMA